MSDHSGDKPSSDGRNQGALPEEEYPSSNADRDLLGNAEGSRSSDAEGSSSTENRDEDFIKESMMDTHSFEADTLDHDYSYDEPSSIQTLSESLDTDDDTLGAGSDDTNILTLDDELSAEEDVQGPAFAASLGEEAPFDPPPLDTPVESDETASDSRFEGEYPDSLDLDDALSDEHDLENDSISPDYDISTELAQALDGDDDQGEQDIYSSDTAETEAITPEIEAQYRQESANEDVSPAASVSEITSQSDLESEEDTEVAVAEEETAETEEPHSSYEDAMMDEPEPIVLPFAYASTHNVMLEDDNTVVHVEPLGLKVLAELRRCIGRPFEMQLIDEEEFKARLAKHYQAADGEAQQAAEEMGADFDLSALAEDISEDGELLAGDGDAPVIRLINAILSQAVQEKASDIHVEQFEEKVSIRFRIDGVMKEILAPKPELGPVLVSRLKVMARLDIAEKRIPQDGRITVKLAGHAVDIRVSTMPSAHGERTVMRILDQAAGALSLEQLNMPPQVVDDFKSALHKPHGIILVTGPTGSGKTTSLYSALSYLNEPSRNILTVEDPVEYLLPGIGQTQVNTKVDMTFVRGLRAILRQDPDVVMIGEIRDKETAAIAVQASLTGHLLLSTLHTNTAIGAVTRLGDLGIEPFLLSSSLEALMAQRLVRVLCNDCKEPHEITEYEANRVGLPEGSLVYRPVGCAKCHHGGYRGRTGIYELIPVDDGLRQLIHEGVGEAKMLAHAREKSNSIEFDGRAKVLAGITSIEELLRVTATAS